MLEIFPPNGFHQSLLTPVLVGLLVTAVATETLGWTFVGLVVPGYLTAVLIAAPWSGVMIIAEALVTYLGARLLGTWLPQLGIGNIAFGRDRFFLLVAISIVVRLVAEGWLIPWLAFNYDFAPAADLYSIGLVAVPLLANACWNVGLKQGTLHVAIVTGITFVLVKFVLLAYTNLSLSEFELTYEEVALDFVGSPKAYLLLLAGTLIATRSNLAWGWDYNGILVPGLLTLAWYHPVKLSATLLEAVLVVAIATVVVRLPPFKRQVIEGHRSTVMLFVIGFLFKWILAWAGISIVPSLSVTDLFGFGYVLPALLAVKIWDKGSVPKVLVPTLATTLLAFAVGNSVGYALSVQTQIRRELNAPPLQALPPTESHSVGAEFAMELASLDTERDLPTDVWVDFVRVLQSPAKAREKDWNRAALIRAVRVFADPAADTSAHRGPAADTSAHRGPAPVHPTWWTGRSASEDQSLPAAVAVSEDAEHTGVVAIEADVAHPLALASLSIAEQLGARAVVVGPPLTSPRLAQRIASELDQQVMLVLRTEAEGARVRAVRTSPPLTAADIGLEQIVAPTGSKTEPARDAEAKLVRRTLLPLEALDGLAASKLGSARYAREKRLSALLNAREERLPSTSTEPLDADVRQQALFSRVIAPAMVRWAAGKEPTAYERAVASTLGYRMAHAKRSTGQVGVLRSRDPLGLLWIAAPPAQEATEPAEAESIGRVFVGAPLVNRGSGIFAASGALFELTSARHLLLGGGHARLRAGTSGSMYQAAVRSLIGKGGRLVELRVAAAASPGARAAQPGPDASEGDASEPAQPSDGQADVVLTVGQVTPFGRGAPDWARALSGRIRRLSLSTRWFDGEAELFRYRGTGTPSLIAARAHHPDQVLVSFWRSTARRRFTSRDRELRLADYGLDPVRHSLSGQMAERRTMRGECDIEALDEVMARIWASQNPLSMLRVSKLGRACRGNTVRDVSAGLVYFVVHDAARVVAYRMDAPPGAPSRTVRSRAGARSAARMGAQRITWSITSEGNP